MTQSELATACLEEILNQRGQMEVWRRQAAERRARVILPEAEDLRVVAAAIVLRELNLARPILVGQPAVIRRVISGLGADPGAFEVVDSTEDPRREAVAAALFDRRRSKGLTQGEAKVLSADPLHLGAGLVARGEAEVMVAGADHPTADVIRAGLFHVGLAEGIRVVSGAFMMVPPEAGARPLLFADAAVIPEPDLDALVAIGLASARSYRSLMGTEPRIACLSFSTMGSATHLRADLMATVAQKLRDHGLVADGELQFDAAMDPKVAEKKAPSSEVAGRAEVFLFPSLEAANIGYKIAQRLGGWDAVGPLVQGLAHPVYDLSRGCTAADVVNTAALAILGAPSQD